MVVGTVIFLGPQIISHHNFRDFKNPLGENPVLLTPNGLFLFTFFKFRGKI